MLHVQGFKANLVRLNGQYKVRENGGTLQENHGRPVFSKEHSVGKDGNSSAVVYFWDERDGENMSGWWVAPHVAAEQVWAFNETAGKTPPRVGWKVPWHQEVDPDVCIQYVNAPSEHDEVDQTVKPNRPSVPDLSVDQQKELLTRIRRALAEFPTLLRNVNEKVDATKDAAVLYTCEIADHIKSEDALAANEEVDNKILAAKKCILDAVRYVHGENDKLNKTESMKGVVENSGPIINTLRAQVDGWLNELKTHKEDITHIKKTKDIAVEKARKEEARIQEQERIKQQEVQAHEIKEMNFLTVETIASYLIYADDLVKRYMHGNNVEELTRLEGLLRGMKEEIERLLSVPGIHDMTVTRAKELNDNKLEDKIAAVSKLAMNIRGKETDVIENLGVRLAEAICSSVPNEEDRPTKFQEITGGSETLSLDRFTAYVKTLDIPTDDELLTKLYTRALRTFARKQEGEELTEAEFFLHLGAVLYKVSGDVNMTSEMGGGIETIDLTQEAPLRVLKGPILSADGDASYVYADAIGQDKTGWVAVRKNGKQLVRRFSPFFITAQETVLTNKFLLKHFKVLKRIATGEKFVALDIPRNDAALLRIKGYLPGSDTPDEIGYVTFRSTKHSVFLKNEPSSDEETVPHIKWSDNADEHKKQIERLVQEQTENLESLVHDVIDRHEMCAVLVHQLDDIRVYAEDVAAITSDQDIKEMIQRTNEAIADTQRSLTKLKLPIARWHTDNGTVPGVETGPLVSLCNLLQDDGIETVNDLQEKLTLLNERARKRKIEVLLDMASRSKLNVAEKTESIRAHLDEQISVRMDALNSSLEIIMALNTTRKTIATLEGTDQERCRVEDLIKSGLETAQEASDWCSERLKDAKQMVNELNAPVQAIVLRKPLAELKKLYRKSKDFAVACKSCNALKESLLQDALCRGVIEIGGALRRHMESMKISAKDLFALICGDVEYMQAIQLIDFLRALAIQVAEDLIARVFLFVATTEGVSYERFLYIVNSYLRVARQCTLTDEEIVGTGMKIRAMSIPETIEGLSVHHESGVLRVKVRCTVDGSEGYVTLRGKTGAEFLKPRGGTYRVAKGTVITDMLAMRGFKLIRRLLPGEIVIAESLPEEESVSGLWRIKGRTLDGSAEGWITLMGNQGSIFLEDHVLFPATVDVKSMLKASSEKVAETKAACAVSQDCILESATAENVEEPADAEIIEAMREN